MTVPELLAPAGGAVQLEAAVRYGADAVYLGAPRYGMRAFADNFSLDDMPEAVAYAHGHGVKLYATLNIFAYDDDFDGLLASARALHDAGVDAAIVADAGVVTLLREAFPAWPLHLSTQANTTNARAAAFWHAQGVSRVILSRELSLERIVSLRAGAPQVALEAFVHGSMCASVSGRCVLSNHLTGRDANQGECAQPCRWKYALVEEKRPGEYMPTGQDDNGFYIYSAKDLCMIGHIDKLCGAGLASLKIEGRMKTEAYVATVTAAYRRAIDRWRSHPAAWRPDEGEMREVARAGHRPFSTGFYFGAPDSPPGTVGTVQTADFIARVLRWENGAALCEQRNKVQVGETITAFSPQKTFDFRVESLYNEEKLPISCAQHPKMLFWIEVERLEPGDLLRRDRNTDGTGETS